MVEREALGFIEQFQRPQLSSDTLEELRELVRQRTQLNRKQVHVIASRAVAPGTEGEPAVSLIVYTPRTSTRRRPALLLVHGGGYVLGDAEGEAEWSEWLAAELDCVVVAPDYRLAPETPHPGPVNDCYAGLKWLWDQAESLQVDRQRIGLFGGSSGGGLAAALTLLARDRKEISLRFQCLLYPMLDDRTAISGDTNPFAGEYGWSRGDNVFGWASLLGHEPGQPGVSQYAAPARASDLSRLPGTYIWVGALDLFVDESIEYARRLVRAGVPTELHVYPGVTHANILMEAAPSTQVCRVEVLRALRSRL